MKLDNVIIGNFLGPRVTKHRKLGGGRLQEVVSVRLRTCFEVTIDRFPKSELFT